MRGFVQRRFNRWLDKRIPANARISLGQRRIFIFPSRQGFYFIGVILLLLIAAINYQNNLIYLLVFFLLSMMNTAILFTYLNLSGLRLRAGKTTAVFAGDYAEFEIILDSERPRDYQQISLSWPANPVQTVDALAGQATAVSLFYKTAKRGYCRPGRILLETSFPLGFLRCWSWIDLDFQALVYPKPMAIAQLPTAMQSGEEGEDKPSITADDFYGFRDYQPGDSIRHIHWPSVAKAQAMQTKVFASQEEQSRWLDWQQLAGYSTEQRLSILTAWVLALEKDKKQWGLRLPTQEIRPDSGERHKHQVLRELALYGLKERVAE